MRIVLALLVGCSGAPPAIVASHAAPSCDPAEWHRLAESTWRGRLHGREVVLGPPRGDRVMVVEQLPNAIIGNEVLFADLDPVVVRRVKLAPGVWAEPGFLADRIEVVREHPIAFRGELSAENVGRVWEQLVEPSQRLSKLGVHIRLRASPVDGVPMVAELDGDLGVRILGFQNGWTHITAEYDHLRVDGWEQDPPHPPTEHTYEFADDTIESSDSFAPPHVPSHPCIRAAPNDDAEIIGLATDVPELKDWIGDWIRVGPGYLRYR